MVGIARDDFTNPTKLLLVRTVDVIHNKLLVLQVFLDHQQNLTGIDWLDQVVIDLGSDGLVHDLLLFILGNHDHREPGAKCFDLAQSIQSGKSGHVFVQKNHIEMLLGTTFHGFRTVVHRRNRTALAFQEHDVTPKQVDLIIRPQNFIVLHTSNLPNIRRRPAVYPFPPIRNPVKKKIVNDPLHGFVAIQEPVVAELIHHPWFQRLRHIRQLGMADMVYPGAGHSRFQHALGAFHLMGRALESLRSKGTDISPEEDLAVRIAILLHDVGHGPLSHALEETLLPGVHHESLTYRFMLALNDQFNGELDLALKIFRNGYERPFLHQLVSGQLDVDRLDYIERDSFFTGVREGNIGTARIIDMLNVRKDKLVVEEKGIYSLENFITSRRLMYWQVYLHKTAVSAERMLIHVIRRAQKIGRGNELPGISDALRYFLSNPVTLADFNTGTEILDTFSKLDDHDIWSALKAWQQHPDRVLSFLASGLVNRKIFRIRMSDRPVRTTELEDKRQAARRHFKVTNQEAAYLVGHGSVSNEAYAGGQKRIDILMKDGQVRDLASVSDMPQIRALTQVVRKNFICYPRELEE